MNRAFRWQTRSTLLLLVTALGLPWQAARAELPTQKEAVALAFPGGTPERREQFLTPEQSARVKASAGTEPSSRFVVTYEVKKDGKLLGVAFFDSHTVRTQTETAMVAVSPQGKVLRVEVVAFREPKEYQAPRAWVAQLEGKSLEPNLSLKGDIHPLAGASLTAAALTDATRRCLALWEIFYKKVAP
jgi:hypothetical protein